MPEAGKTVSVSDLCRAEGMEAPATKMQQGFIPQAYLSQL